MLEMSWITSILLLFSQVTDLFGNVIVKRINIRLFDLLALFHYILNLPRRNSSVSSSCSDSDFWTLGHVGNSRVSSFVNLQCHLTQGINMYRV